MLSSGADDSAAEEGFDDDSLDDVKRGAGAWRGKGSEGGQAEPVIVKVSAEASPARYSSTEGDAGKPPTVGAPVPAAGSTIEAEQEEEEEDQEREEEEEEDQDQEQEEELTTEGEEGDDATSENASEDHDDDDDEEDRYGYTNGASYGSPEASSQVRNARLNTETLCCCRIVAASPWSIAPQRTSRACVRLRLRFSLIPVACTFTIQSSSRAFGWSKGCPSRF